MRAHAVGFLRSECRVKFAGTGSEEDARVLESALVALFKPYFNAPLRGSRREIDGRVVA